MKKKIIKGLLLIVFCILAVLASFNTYTWIVSGEQQIKISMAQKAYTNSDIYVSIIAQKNGVDLEAKTQVKLLDSNGKKVKDVEVSYDESTAIISVPEIKAGNYIIEAKVASKVGRDTIQKQVYISNGNAENVTINFDKGIYKPGDTVNFRTLLTTKENDEPVKKEANISIYDGNENKVYNENVVTSDYGIISGSFTLASEVNSGIYKMVVKTDATETIKQFKVNPYVTPKYEVKIGFDKQNYLVGDTATINIDGNYFFGEPVSNAKYTIYIDGNEYQDIIANQEGKAAVSYKIEKAKQYTVKVEATDSSNYFVEETSTFVAGTDLFEIEILPEYGTLVAGEKNDVYVFTKNADGTPIKTYITISSGDYTKQVATDENGIGKFSTDIDSIKTTTYKNNNTKKFTLVAENMNGDKINKIVNLTVENKNILLTTNKVKYNQGEDIEITVSSDLENTKNIYFFKNDKLIKMLSTESLETSVNLEDVYGLIDIYITEGGTTSRYKNNSFKKTVFIKPSKVLNIDINTDKQEYKPGDNISISFDTKDENNNSVEAALLVSMLDNAILNLAENDLSIDNIKLALSNVNFTDELDAATLYSCIIDDTSEQTMMGLLLKQESKDISISETTMNNYEQESKSATIAIISIVLLCVIIVSYLCYKFAKFRNLLKHALNYIIFNFVLGILVIFILYEVFDVYVKSSLQPWILGAICVINLAIYVLWISKLNKKIFRTSISIITLLGLLIVSAILIEAFDIELGMFLLIVALLILGVAIILRANIENKIVEKIDKQVVYICKFIGAVLLATIVTYVIQEIIDIEVLAIPFAIIGIYLLNFLFNKNNETDEQDVENDGQATEKSITKTITIVLAVIGAVAVIYVVVNVLTSTFSDKRDDINFSGGTSSGSSGGDVWDITTDIATPDSITSDSSGLGNIGSIFESAGSFIESGSKSETNSESSNIETETVETTTDDNIRNIFLESMCFIPELITDNGNAQLDLKLSDNITTWTIQTVGNTKDGKIGYGMLDTVKVFKEFFVDFELPKNLVETDIISVPVTVYNYTKTTMSTTLKIQEEEWFSLQDKTPISLSVDAESSKMVYIPITILKAGSNKFRVEAIANSVSDIIEKEITVYPKGYKVEKVVSTGTLDEDISEDILILEDIVENTASVKVKIYASTMSQNVEGMENIFKMPTGCFEQVSSSLYPNILALKYIEENGIVNEELKAKAINYISSGYQKLLTYEVQGESGGFSLYGRSPAETVLTAYGLMELTDLQEVYKVDESVIERMTDFMYKKQNTNGSFTITGSHIGGASSRETLALNAYITWALSESDPNNGKLTKSIEYLKNKLDDVDDNYTLALIANALANVNDKQVDNVIKRLVNNVNVDGSSAYITSNVRDYYGSRTNSQTIQTVALTSMALSKTSKNTSTNKSLINYLISKKDTRGTWYSTQATILSLKALNELNEKNKLDNQTIKVKVNSEEQTIEIKDNPLELYELTFENLNKENKLSIDIESGNAYYEVVEEYYIPYENVDTSNDNIEVTVQANNELKVNDILDANIKVINRSDNDIYNGMVTISVPQGFTVNEESLMLLETKGIIEKYEMSYAEVNLYLRNFEVNQIVNLDVKFRASYPVEITGLAVRAYDYYNPEIEGKSMPINIKVNN